MLKHVTILRDTDTQTDFEIGDIVSICTNEGMIGKTYEGKITFIDIEWLEVDCSELYKNNLRKFKFKDIIDINKIKG